MYLSLSLKVFSKCICHCLCLLYLCSSLFFCWSVHVFSSLWSNVSKVKSLKDCSLKVFSKCICHCLCHCLCICLRRCLFVGQVMFSYDPNQFSEVLDWSGRPEGFDSRTANIPEQLMTKVGLDHLSVGYFLFTCCPNIWCLMSFQVGWHIPKTRK